MSEFLKKLKALKFENTPTPEPSKPSKPPFEGFEGAYPGIFSKKNFNPDVRDQKAVPPISDWRAAVTALHGPLNKDAGTLLLATLAFLDSEHAERAVSLGWSEVALFGVHTCAAPRQRLEGCGLVPTLGWSVLSLSIRSIAADHVVILSENAQGGSELIFRRDKPGLARAEAWWGHPVLSGRA